MDEKNYLENIFQNIANEGIEIDFFLEKQSQFKNNNDFTSSEKIELMEQYRKLYFAIAKNIAHVNLEQKMLLRFHLLDKDWISKKDFDKLKNISADLVFDETDNTKDIENMFFVDEWLEEILEDKKPITILDEVKWNKKKYKNKNSTNLNYLISAREEEKEIKASIIANLTFLKISAKRLKKFFRNLSSIINNYKKNIKEISFSGTIYKIFVGVKKRKKQFHISHVLKSIWFQEKENNRIYNKLKKIFTRLKTFKTNQKESNTVKASEIKLNEKIIHKKMTEECLSMWQMMKICTGKMGNHFFLLLDKQLKMRYNFIAYKKDIFKYIKEVEQFDKNLFIREVRTEFFRIFPYIIIVPCYGDKGICWEAFPRANKKMGRGKLILPLFPSNLKKSILIGLAHFRWENNKEKNAHRWMEEGLSGRYYDYYVQNKIRTPILQNFINDYILWIEYESQGLQKLNKEVRKIFWHHIPFPEEIKVQLRKRAFIYNQLYQSEQLKKANN